ncbi:MAG: amidohydrolase [Phycisphaerae bacterium]|nr:amidohydrolase [Gemmatimonadaceae bacterium]
MNEPYVGPALFETDSVGNARPLGGDAPLIDVHAHFHGPNSSHVDANAYNRSRISAGRRIGVRCHVASVLGSWGRTSPTYFPSPDDLTAANNWMVKLAASSQGEVRAFIAVNPNHPAHALQEIQRGVEQGAIGIKLAASRRADDVLLDEIGAAAAAHRVPVLHHVWQHRRRDWPNQDASDGVELSRLAERHPSVTFILAHIGGGGDWAHTFPAVREVPNVVMDLSGSGIDRGMMDEAVRWVGAQRVLWAADLTLCTGLTKLRALDVMGLSAIERADIRWRNAVRIFPDTAFTSVVKA